MFDYVPVAADARTLLAEFGTTRTLRRFNRGTFDPVTGAITAVTYRTQQVAVVVLPLKAGSGVTGLSDALMESLRKGKLRKLLIGASGLDFAPDVLDVLYIGTETFIIQSVDVLAPGGVDVLYTGLAEKSNLSAADLAATLAT